MATGAALATGDGLANAQWSCSQPEAHWQIAQCALLCMYNTTNGRNRRMHPPVQRDAMRRFGVQRDVMRRFSGIDVTSTA